MSRTPALDLRVDAERLLHDLDALGEIGRLESGGITRTSFSAEDARAREWYRDRCDAAGLQLRVDGLGNMVAERPGDSDRPAVWSGSHIDTVPLGGAFDGAVGSVAALECVRRLAEEGIDLPRPVHAVVFSDEEGNYGHLLGSGGLVWGYDQQQLEVMMGRDGDSLLDALTGSAWSAGSPLATRKQSGSVDSFVELHIEQGPRLEHEHAKIGIVTSIVGLGGGVAEFTGRPDHAGTTPMTMRRDPVLAAATFIGQLPSLAASVSPAAVATAGRIDVTPGAANVVAHTARVLLDFRDPDPSRLLELGQRIEQLAATAAAEHDLTVDWRPDDVVAPTHLAELVRSAVRQSADALGLPSIELPSGAGHDAQNLAHLAPTGMIFIPSRDGRSHSALEWTDPEDIVNGANVLLATLVRLAERR